MKRLSQLKHFEENIKPFDINPINDDMKFL